MAGWMDREMEELLKQKALEDFIRKIVVQEMESHEQGWHNPSR